MALSKLSLGKTFITCIVVEVLQLLLHEKRDVIVRNLIHSIAAPICSFNVSLVSSDLNQKYQ